MRRKAAAEKWTELKRQAAAEIGKRLVEKTVAQAVDVRGTADRLWEILDAGVRDGSLIKGPKAIKEIAQALEVIRRVRADPDDAEVRMQEAKIAKLRRETDRDGEDRAVRVVIEGDADAYSG